jgi:S-adenosylmethionine:tRNA ribosyltransferase-isomerase
VLLSDFDFELPEELIAQAPLEDRAASRMLHVVPSERRFEDRRFRDFVSLLRDDDLLVFNNTRVIPARLFGHRSGQHAQPLSPHNPAMREFLRGKVEVLLTKQITPLEWEALVRPGRKLGVGERISFGEDASALHCEIVARGEFGERTVRFDPVSDFDQRLERLGHMPLPPYISREDTAADRDRYQTVFAKKRGAAAAPTAGLHFTPEILQQLKQRGIETAEVTLHVGLGTFQPLREAVVEKNRLHRERYEIEESAAEAIARAQQQKRRIVATGTTAVRTLEFAARQDGQIRACSGEADIFIYPGYPFRVVGALLTNFHLPESSLLMLVSAFAGREFVLEAYRHAVEQRYRFFSYGDCMFVE